MRLKRKDLEVYVQQWLVEVVLEIVVNLCISVNQKYPDKIEPLYFDKLDISNVPHSRQNHEYI